MKTATLPHYSDAERRIDLEQFASIDLATLNAFAQLQTRKDRKYVLPADALATLLAGLPEGSRCLETAGNRWSGYESVYFDTAHLDSYRLAATRRPRRFKVRTRTYLDSETTFAEIKLKNARGRTVKHRRLIEPGSSHQDASVLSFASEFDDISPYAPALAPVLRSSYRRATFVLPGGEARITVDSSLRCTDIHGSATGLHDKFIIETKTTGAPSTADRLLWRIGHRPEKISKYATGLAAVRPELSANRWRPVLRKYFPLSDASAHSAPTPHPKG